MIISSWNVNSVRARIENIKSYLLKYKPDIIMMADHQVVVNLLLQYHQIKPQERIGKNMLMNFSIKCNPLTELDFQVKEDIKID